MRWRRVLPLVALVATSIVGVRSAAEAEPAGCNEEDRPETGIQGAVPVPDQLDGTSKLGYRCRIRPVSTQDFGTGGDIQLTWYKHCAYQVVPSDGTSEGVAVADVTDPTAPEHVTTIRRAEWAGRGGALGIHEGIHTSDRNHVLVVPVGHLLSVFDVADCRNPVHVRDIEITPSSNPTYSEEMGGGGIHSGQLSADGSLYYATNIGNGAVAPSGPCLTVVDVATGETLTTWGDFPCHDLELRPDGTRAYVGYYEQGIGHPSAVVGAFTPAGQPAHLLSGIKIVDITGVRDGVVSEISSLPGGRQHTQVYARQGDREFLLGAEEAYCPGGNGRIVEITDERNPVQLSEITLEVNQAPSCAQSADNANGDVLHYMSHYLSVDDTDHAELAFYTWYGSGLRVFDISDPAHPREVAYYNPPVVGSDRTHDSSTTYPRYVASKGQIWFGSRVNGLNVVELDPALRPGGGRWSVEPVTAPPAPSSVALPVAAEPVGYCTLR